MIIALDHVAIAVPDIEKSIKRFAEDFGLEYSGSEAVSKANTLTAFFPVPGTSIELVHPLDGQGPIAKYLDNKGGGIHHLCFQSDNLAEDIERLKAKGYKFTSDAPTSAAHNAKAIFVHPKSCDGVLIELIQFADNGEFPS